jgi:predicted Fe-Mo cluster-binding NifX family protein
MRVAVSSEGKNLQSQIDPRFGRCRYFIICETDNMSFEVFDNESISLGGGAGIQAAQDVASKGVEAVITGNCGPNAVKALGAGGITLFVGQSGVVKDAIERFKNNELTASKEANVPDHYGARGGDSPPVEEFKGSVSDQYPNFETGRGMGGGRGMGRGMGMCGGKGMGRGMGMGGGRGMGQGMGMTGGGQFNNIPGPDLSRDQELDLLKRQSEELLRQVGEIQDRINRLESK